MSEFYYVTAASGESFIKDYTQYAIKSLLKTNVPPDEIHVIGRSKEDIRLIKKLFPYINIHQINEDISHVKWKYMGGKRKYAYFKAAAVQKTFPKPIDGKYMVHFDGDVLWYKNPYSFFKTKCDKTWYHHGKDMGKRSKAGKDGLTVHDIDVTNYKSLGRWCSQPQAWLMVKWGCKFVPQREVVSGLYLLHPRDHEKLLYWTYKGCQENAKKFAGHEGCGEQKPMNAALAYLEIDWHGGSRFFCPEHEEYFFHFFGAKEMKKDFRKKIKEMKL